MAKITVVNVVSCSYTGTTWLNILLGCHQRAMALGPFDVVWNRRRGGLADCCQIHGESCPLWREFARRYDENRNFFVQLSELTGKDVFVINNPHDSQCELDHEDVRERVIRLFRDGRAISASFHRKHPAKYSPTDNYFYVVRDWWKRAFAYFHQRRIEDPQSLSLRYEDLVDDLVGQIGSINQFLEIDYQPQIERYWEYEHHIPAGNGGPIYLTAKFQGLRHAGDEGNDVWYQFYRDQFRQMQQSGTVRDERWKRELTRRDLFVFDWFSGADNALYGYPRDEFTAEERRRFTAYIERLDASPTDADTTRAEPRGFGRFMTRLRGVLRRAG